MASVYLGLGSNVAAEKNLRLAIHELESRYGEVAISPVYKSGAVGFEGADFLNLVVGLESDASPLEICNEMERIHDLAGRIRSDDKWGPRPLDIDLLLYDDAVISEPPVRVPRDDILEFGFVLRPLAEIAPDLVHPVTGRTMRDHWLEFDTSNHPLEAARFSL